MGLLTWILSKRVGKPKELARTIARRKTVEKALKIGVYIYWIFFPLGLILLLCLPFVYKYAKPDENALSIAQTSRMFNLQDSSIGESFIQSWTNESDERKHELLLKEFQDIGLKSSQQLFNIHSMNSNETVQRNTFGILKAPRGDGTESIVLSAPLRCADGELNSFGISQLVSIGQFAARRSMWAKDIIFLVPDASPTGSYIFLKAYHGLQEPQIHFTELEYHSGVIQAAINLEFCGGNSFSGLGLYAINLNGELPNADLVVTAALSALYEGLEIRLHDDTNIRYHSDEQFQFYLSKARNLFYFMWQQAVGIPLKDHSFYQQYKIESITLKGIPSESNPKQEYKVSRFLIILLVLFLMSKRTIECILYSLNNLLERFHHSFWFYFLIGPDLFIPLGLYIGPVVLVCISLIFYSLIAWFSSTCDEGLDSKEGELNTELNQECKSYYIRPKNIKIHSITNRNLRVPLVWTTRILCLSWITSFSITRLEIQNQEFKIFLIGLGFILQMILTRVYYNHTFDEFEFKTIKSLLCLGVGTLLIGIATINPSQSVFLSLLLVPTLLQLRQKSVSSCLILFLVSPFGLWIGFSLLYSPNSVLNWILLVYHQWRMYGSSLAWILIYIYWPILLLSWNIS